MLCDYTHSWKLLLITKVYRAKLRIVSPNAMIYRSYKSNWHLVSLTHPNIIANTIIIHPSSVIRHSDLLSWGFIPITNILDYWSYEQSYDGPPITIYHLYLVLICFALILFKTHSFNLLHDSSLKSFKLLSIIIFWWKYLKNIWMMK